MILQEIYLCIYMLNNTYFSQVENYSLWNVVIETGQLEKTVGHQL